MVGVKDSLEGLVKSISRVSKLGLCLTSLLLAKDALATHGNTGTYAAYNHRWHEAPPNPGWRRNVILTFNGQPYGYQEIPTDAFIDSENASQFTEGYWSLDDFWNGIAVQVDEPPRTPGQQAALDSNRIGCLSINSQAYQNATQVENDVELWIRSHLRNQVAISDSMPTINSEILTVFPNPYKPGLDLHITTTQQISSTPSNWYIYDITGRLVTEFSNSLIPISGNQYTLDRSVLSPLKVDGIYFIRGNNRRIKFVVNK